MPPSWWKSSSKEAKKKENKESSVDVLLRKLRFSSDDKGSSRSVDSRGRIIDTHSEIGNISRAHSRSPSPLASRCQSFAERPLAQPLPLPREHLKNIGCNVPVINASTKPKSNRGSKHMMFFPLQVPVCGLSKSGFTDTEDDLATGPVNSDGTSDSDDPSDSHLPSPQASDCDNGTRTNLNSPTSVMQKIQSPSVIHKNSKGMGKPALFNFNDQNLPTSPIRGSGNHLHNIQIPQNRTLFTAPDSSMSSPSRSPMRSYEPEHTINTGFWTGKPYSEVSFLGSGNCSSPGSGHNSVAGDNIAAQLFWQQRSTECSPIPSPRMSSPGPSSRIPSGCVTPTHARSAGVAMESPKSRPDNGKQQSYRLPVPPLTIANTCPFSPTYSAATSPSVPRSPNRTENPTSPAAKWQKGRLLGRGSFGHVYLGFNRESGEMCAMKEVTLFSDDAKSKESAQQLGQEIALLSRLRHPNIVQYYGSETVDDKLYIYLEYVSGGSIYKLLQDYGQFGELAIRSYTQQILSGLAFLHAKSTVHRDIKGANILVDPHGRVKLADFGMAKHITGPACPLSFKGSPYWMAPEVIRNSNGCNLAVDIWSLGCTVLEMATTKPPWSEYAGVPALFKIGNSKELPAIPDHLSEDGKDFVKKCLQRNPFHRPTAAQLLEHPFVKNAAPLAKPIPVSDPSESPSPIITAARSLGIGEGVAVSQARGSNISPGFSDTFARRNMSCPVSPIDTPMLHSRSPQHASGRMSPSPISSPRGTSGASTPLTGGAGAIPFSHQKQPATYLKGCLGTHQRSQHSSYLSGNTFHQIQELGLFQRLPPQMSHVFPDMKSSENGMMGNHYGRILHGEPKDRGDGKLVLADRVSQQLLRDHLTLSSSPNFNPNVSTHDHMNGT